MKVFENSFWAMVDRKGQDDCWEWKNHKLPTGYGIIKSEGKTVYAHRLAWIFANGDIPKGLWVLHKCDNPSCCNPGHLFIGTALDNSRDRDAKGRSGSPKWRGIPQRIKRNGHLFKGVTYDKWHNNWRAQIKVNGHNVWIGNYSTAEMAAKAYDKFARDKFGDIAYLNFMDEGIYDAVISE